MSGLQRTKAPVADIPEPAIWREDLPDNGVRISFRPAHAEVAEKLARMGQPVAASIRKRGGIYHVDTTFLGEAGCHDLIARVNKPLTP